MSTQSPPKSRIAEILRRIVGPDAGDLPPDAARSFLRLKLHEQDSRRLGDLLEKNREGELISGEREELDDYLNVSTLMDLLRAKSFVSLKRAGFDPPNRRDE